MRALRYNEWMSAACPFVLNTAAASEAGTVARAAITKKTTG